MESDTYGIPIELMGGREFGLCDHCKKFQAVGILNDHAWEIAFERYSKLSEEKKKGRFKQVRRFLPKWYPFRGEDASKNQRRVEFYEKLGKTPPKLQVKRGSMTSSIGYVNSPTASVTGSDMLPINKRRGIRRPNMTVPNVHVQTEVTIVDLTLDDEQTQQTSEKTNSNEKNARSLDDQSENCSKDEKCERIPVKEENQLEEEQLLMKNEIASPEPETSQRKISRESNFSIPSLEDLELVPLQEELDLRNLPNELPSPQNNGELLIDDEMESEKTAELANNCEESKSTTVDNPENSPEAAESHEIELDENLNTNHDQKEKEENIQELNFESNEDPNVIEETTNSDAMQVEAVEDQSENSAEIPENKERRKSILEEAFEKAIEKEDNDYIAREPFDLEKIIQETVGNIENASTKRKNQDEADESLKVAMASDSDSELRTNFKSRDNQTDHDSIDEFSYDEESIKSLGKVDAAKMENLDDKSELKVRSKEEPARGEHSDAALDKKEFDSKCDLAEKEVLAKEEGAEDCKEETTIELLEGAAKTEVENGFEDAEIENPGYTHLTISQDEQDWQNGQAMVHETSAADRLASSLMANGAASVIIAKQQRSSSVDVESESGDELDVGTRADEIAFYKTLQREKIVIPVQTKEDEIIDVMSTRSVMDKPLTVTPDLDISPDCQLGEDNSKKDGVFMTAVPRLSELGTGRKRSVPEDGGVISDDSPERSSSRSIQPSIGKRSTQVRLVNSMIQNAFLDTRTSTPTLKLVSASRSGLTFPPPNSVRQLHQNEFSAMTQPERMKRSPKMQHHPYSRAQMPQGRIHRLEQNTQYIADPLSRISGHEQGSSVQYDPKSYLTPNYRTTKHAHQAQQELQRYQMMNQAHLQQSNVQRNGGGQARGLVTGTIRQHTTQTSVMQFGNTPLISQDQLNSVLHQSGQAEQYVHSSPMARGPPQLQERFHSPFNSFRHPFAVPHFNGAPNPFALFNPRLPSTQGLPFPPQPFTPFFGPAQNAHPRMPFNEQPSEVNALLDKNESPKLSPKDMNGNSIELRPHMQDPLYVQTPHNPHFHNIHQKEVLKSQQAPPAQEPSNKPVSSTTTSQCSNVSSSSSSSSSRSQSSTPHESIVFKNQNNDCRPPMFSILDTFYPKKLEF